MHQDVVIFTYRISQKLWASTQSLKQKIYLKKKEKILLIKED